MPAQYPLEEGRTRSWQADNEDGLSAWASAPGLQSASRKCGYDPVYSCDVALDIVVDVPASQVCTIPYLHKGLRKASKVLQLLSQRMAYQYLATRVGNAACEYALKLR